MTTSNSPHFERRVPRPFNHARIAPLFLWLRLIRRYRRYDFVLLRYPMPDVFSWALARFVPNLITIHHTKELEELESQQTGMRRIVASAIERKLQPVAFRHLFGLIAVTKEIELYERSRFIRVSRSSVMPNGYDVAGAEPVEDRRSDELQFVFIASKFFEWHGLDLVLQSLSASVRTDYPFTLHLIGELSEEQLRQVSSINSVATRVVCHGVVNENETAEILAHCDVALGSLALSRKGLSEASTLKVREYLASGLPVYSTHQDSGLPDDFPFYKREDVFSLESLIEFANQTKQLPRHVIADAAQPFIDKGALMAAMVEVLRSWKR